MQKIKIGTHLISRESQPFIIAEMSGNHNQSVERALAIVDAAADAGAHAIKLQTYTADTITVKGAHTINDENSLWKGRELYDLYQEAHTPWEWHRQIFDHAAKRGIMAFSSPFDETSVDFLEQLGVPAYKIASFENTDWTLLRKVARTGKPVIMSTGASTLADVDQSLKVLKDHGCKDIILLKCTSTYPATPENTNLATIPYMREVFGTQVGLSDHTMGIGAAVAAVALGATVIEKHFTLNRADGGVDSAFSLEPHELKALVTETQRAHLAIGTVRFGVLPAEENSLKYKRSLFIVDDIKKGEVLSGKNVSSKRPATGLHTSFIDIVIGKKARTDLKKGTPLSWDMID